MDENTAGISLEQVPDIPEGEPFAREWKAFKRDVLRLVEEGKAGKFAVFKDDRLVGVWDTLDLADQAGRQQCNGDAFLIQEIQLFLRPWRWGYHRPCPS